MPSPSRLPVVLYYFPHHPSNLRPHRLPHNHQSIPNVTTILSVIGVLLSLLKRDDNDTDDPAVDLHGNLGEDPTHPPLQQSLLHLSGAHLLPSQLHLSGTAFHYVFGQHKLRLLKFHLHWETIYLLFLLRRGTTYWVLMTHQLFLFLLPSNIFRLRLPHHLHLIHQVPYTVIHLRLPRHQLILSLGILTSTAH